MKQFSIILIKCYFAMLGVRKLKQYCTLLSYVFFNSEVCIFNHIVILRDSYLRREKLG